MFCDAKFRRRSKMVGAPAKPAGERAQTKEEKERAAALLKEEALPLFIGIGLDENSAQ